MPDNDQVLDVAFAKLERDLTYIMTCFGEVLTELGQSAIAARLALSQPQTSKHLRVLRSAGLVAVAPRAQQRLYALRPEPLRECRDWIERFRRIWEARFDALDDLLERMRRKESRG